MMVVFGIDFGVVIIVLLIDMNVLFGFVIGNVNEVCEFVEIFVGGGFVDVWELMFVFVCEMFVLVG